MIQAGPNHLGPESEVACVPRLHASLQALGTDLPLRASSARRRLTLSRAASRARRKISQPPPARAGRPPLRRISAVAGLALCPEETPYLVDHDYAPAGTQLAKGVEIKEDTDPWAINIYAPMYASTPIDPKKDNAWVSDGYLIGLHAWNLHAEGQVDSGVIVNSVTHWGVAIGGEGHHYKLHCTDDKSRAATGKYIPLNEETATKQQITRTLYCRGSRPDDAG
jgi:hypothetical protein